MQLSFRHRDCVLLKLRPDVLFHLQFDDQGIVNTDARTIAVPDSYVNMIPTDVRGLTFSRTPQQNINILTLGNPDGVGVFFPNGLIGAISKPTGFNETASGTDDFPTSPMVASQVSLRPSPQPPPPVPPQVSCCSVCHCRFSFMFGVVPTPACLSCPAESLIGTYAMVWPPKYCSTCILYMVP